MAYVFFYRQSDPWNVSLDIPENGKGRPTIEDAIKDAVWRFGPNVQLNEVKKTEYPFLRKHGHCAGAGDDWHVYDLFIVEADVESIPFDALSEELDREDRLQAEEQIDGLIWDQSVRSASI